MKTVHDCRLKLAFISKKKSLSPMRVDCTHNNMADCCAENCPQPKNLLLTIFTQKTFVKLHVCYTNLSVYVRTLFCVWSFLVLNIFSVENITKNLSTSRNKFPFISFDSVKLWCVSFRSFTWRHTSSIDFFQVWKNWRQSFSMVPDYRSVFFCFVTLFFLLHTVCYSRIVRGVAPVCGVNFLLENLFYLLALKFLSLSTFVFYFYLSILSTV